jgi:hypothetical protein
MASEGAAYRDRSGSISCGKNHCEPGSGGEASDYAYMHITQSPSPAALDLVFDVPDPH